MKLSNIFSFKKKKEPQKFFLAVEISLETVKSAVWTVEQKSTQVKSIGSVEEWDGEDKEKLLQAVDRSISNAVQGIDREPYGVIFGLPFDWVDKDNINKDKKEFLKYLCQKLELKPLGFVVILESLLTYLKLQEGTPVNAVVINLLETQSVVSLVRIGRIQGMEIVARSEDLAADVKEGLARFDDLKDLPARIILFDGQANLEEYKQQLISFAWTDELPFLHFPKIESLSLDTSIKAIAEAGGAEVAKSLGFTIDEQKEDKKDEQKEPTQDKEPTVEEIEQKEPAEAEEQPQVSAEDLGFVYGEDVLKTNPELEEQSEKERQEEKSIKRKQEEKVEPQKEVTAVAETQKPEKKKRKLEIFKKFKNIFKKKAVFVIITALLGLGLFAGAVFAFYWYIPKATVTLFLEPKVLEKEIELAVDPQVDKLDIQQKVIPGKTEKAVVQTELSKQTTGEKLIGEKAQGKVTIYNKTDIEKVFDAGTVLVGPDDLGYLLSEQVKVASRSAQEEGIDFGKAEAQAAAADIGTDYNFDGEASFTFKEYPESVYSAKTDSGFSGGTSREINVVSEDDINSLLKDAQQELKDKALQKLESDKKPGEKIFIEEDLEISSEEYSAEEGEEVNNITLKAEAELTAFIYQEQDLEEVAKKLIAEEEAGSFIEDPEKFEFSVQDSKMEEDVLKVNLSVKSYLLPKIDFTEVKDKLAGHYPHTIQDYLKSLPNFIRADIKIRPNLPAKLKTLPRLPKNIIIETEIEE